MKKVTKSEKVVREYLKVYTPPEKADIDYLMRKTGVCRETIRYALYSKVPGYAREPHKNNYREYYKDPKKGSFVSKVIDFIDKNPDATLSTIQEGLKVPVKKRWQIKTAIKTWRPIRFEGMFGEVNPEEGSNSELVVKRFDNLIRSEKFISLSDMAKTLGIPVSTVHDALNRWRPEYKLFLKSGSIDPIDALVEALLKESK